MQTSLGLRASPACPVAGTRRKVVTRAGPGGEREPWDFGRFVNTVAFFNEGLLQKTLQGTVDGVAKALRFGTQQAGISASPQPVPVAALAAANDPLDPVIPVPVEGVILVTGATGGVGQRVVRKLLAAGKTVRALVRDVEKGKQLLSGLPAAPGAQLQVVAADLTQPRTLLPEYFSGVRAVVSCAAVKVQPKEGDDNRRSRYMQGIKFYDPEIVGDTPEAVELRGMQNLLSALGTRLGRTQGLPLLQVDGSGTAWGALDDVVMGGVSKSRITRVEGAGEDGGPAMVFSGLVSTSNSGGFASVRCRNFEPALDLAAFTGIELRLKGNGQRFKCILRPDDNWDGISYCRSFDTQPGVWQTIHIPFHEFFPVFRARTLKDAAPLDPSSISSVQLMLSKFEYDGELNPAFTAGEFELPITRLAAYMEQPAPRFVHVSSAFVTRPTRPGIDLEQEPPVVKLNSMLGGVLDFKLAGEDTLRASGVPFAIVRPCALTEEPRGMPLEFDQGDMIRGKMSREDLSELCCALLSEPSLQGTTFEVRSQLSSTSQPWQVDPASPPPVRDWSAELRAAKLVPGVTGKTIDGVYTGKQPEAQFTSASRPLVSSR